MRIVPTLCFAIYQLSKYQIAGQHREKMWTDFHLSFSNFSMMMAQEKCILWLLMKSLSEVHTYQIHVSLFEKYSRHLLMSPFVSNPNTVCTVMRLKKGSRQTYWALKSPPHQIIKWKAKPTLTLQSLTYLILRIRQEMMIKRIF